MQTSEQINELAAALAEAQGAFAKVTKGKTAKIKSEKANYEYRYADLGEVIETVRPTLTKHGLSVVQMPTLGSDNRTMLSTMLLHKSGQWIKGEIPIQWQGGDPKTLGSLLTYLRRYTYTGAIGVATEEDDDGASANAAPQSPPQPRQPPKSPAKAPTQPNGNGARPGATHGDLARAAMSAAADDDDRRRGGHSEPFSDPLPIPDADGDIEVVYTDSRGGEHMLPSAKALAKIETAHKSTISDAALDDLIRVNRAWLATHYGPALKAFEGAPRPWAGG
jgi:hypothetical protein